MNFAISENVIKESLLKRYEDEMIKFDSLISKLPEVQNIRLVIMGVLMVMCARGKYNI